MLSGAEITDEARAREVLGWEPKVMLREGLSKTIAWFKEQKHLKGRKPQIREAIGESGPQVKKISPLAYRLSPAPDWNIIVLKFALARPVNFTFDAPVS